MTADANAECSYYTYQPVVDAKSQFPTIWDIASIVPGDTEAQALFSQIDALVNSSVGDVRIKGTPNGDFCKPTCPWKFGVGWMLTCAQRPSLPHTM